MKEIINRITLDDDLSYFLGRGTTDEQGNIIFPDLQRILPIPWEYFLEISPENNDAEIVPNSIYQWCLRNLGNYLDDMRFSFLIPNIIEFETNVTPIPSIPREMSISYPNSLIIYEYAGWDGICTCGLSLFKNGEHLEQSYDGDSLEAYDLLFKLQPYLRDNFEYVDGEYRYKNV